MSWVFLLAAIVLEVVGTAALRGAVAGDRRWYAAVLVAYVGAFAGLQLALRHGLALGIAYGTWAAVGVVLTAIVSKVVFREPLTLLMGAGMTLIVGGVLVIELGSAQ